MHPSTSKMGLFIPILLRVYTAFKSYELLGFFLFILQGELGANAILAVSIAACKAGAAEKEAFFFPNLAFTYIYTVILLMVLDNYL